MNKETKQKDCFDCNGLGLQAYTGYFRDLGKVRKVSSGGAATALGEAIIDQGGVVFGVRYADDFMSAQYDCATNIVELERFRGSKYVESRKKFIHNGVNKSVYEHVIDYLSLGRVVLFFGLGCDCGALIKYLEHKRISHSNLFLAELFCWGCTYEFVFNSFIRELKDAYKTDITYFSMREKGAFDSSWHLKVMTKNGKQITSDFTTSEFYYAWRNVARKSCYDCKFKGNNHKGDIVLGDYWGITRKMKGYNPMGNSLIIQRTDKGRKLINLLNNTNFLIFPTDVEYAISHNKAYYLSRTMVDGYECFLNDIKEYGLKLANERNIVKVRINILSRTIRKIKNFIKYLEFIILRGKYDC